MHSIQISSYSDDLTAKDDTKHHRNLCLLVIGTILDRQPTANVPFIYGRVSQAVGPKFRLMNAILHSNGACQKRPSEQFTTHSSTVTIWVPWHRLAAVHLQKKPRETGGIAKQIAKGNYMPAHTKSHGSPSPRIWDPELGHLVQTPASLIVGKNPVMS